MYIGWHVWSVFLFHEFLTTSATHMVSPELQGYENLIPYRELYESCLDESLSNCAEFLHDDVIKRSPQFNAWGGKRAKFSSWGGKRGLRQFNSWGGKRTPLAEAEEFFTDDEEGMESIEKRAKFSSWGGKRDIVDEKRAKFNSWGGKRAPKFSSWGGKRSPEVFNAIKRDFGTGYNRKPAFNSWGGKRSDANFDVEEHNINKRDVEEKAEEEHMPDLWKEFFDRISNPNFNKNNPYDPTISTISVPVKKSPDSHLQNLFKQFVYWSGNSPGEKKNMIMNSRLLKDRYSIPMRRGSADFYAWGGKRSGVKSAQ